MTSCRNRVYLGHITAPDAQERDVKKFFDGYGRINEVVFMKTFAFVEFDDSRDAEDAVADLNGKKLLGDRVLVEFARGRSGGHNRNSSSRRDGGDRYGDTSYSSRRSPPSHYSSSSSSFRGGSRFGLPRRTKYRILVDNLSSRVNWQDLKDFMRQAGTVTFADAHKPERNSGVVDFESYSDMKAAISKFDGVEFYGRTLRIEEDKGYRGSGARDRRSRSRSHGRSRSPVRRKSSSKAARSRSRGRSNERRSPDRRSHDRHSSPRNRGSSPKRGRMSHSKSPDTSTVRRRSMSRDSHSRSNSVASPNGRKSRSPSVGSGKSGGSRCARSSSRSRSRSRSVERQNGGGSPGSNRSRTKSPSQDRKSSASNED